MSNFTKICNKENFTSNSTISGVRFCNNDPNILFVANNKSILLYDLRTKYEVQTFEGKYVIFHRLSMATAIKCNVLFFYMYR